MPSPPVARRVFVSYSHDDSELVLPFVRLLQAAGAVVFVDTEDINYGDRWEEVLLEHLEAAERILLFWSKNASNSEWPRTPGKCWLAGHS